MVENKFKFVDLFSGIGGFHQALLKHGGVCVFASEVDSDAIQVYKNNYNMDSFNDITKVDEDFIPKHDVLTAGFPCQAFSKAGKQNGFDDTRGTLFFDIQRILRKHKTKLIILENVRNLTSHDNGRTWKIIYKTLKNIGYRLTEKPLILSPHHFGVPHLRERVFIVGIYDPKNVEIPLEIKFNKLLKKSDNDIFEVLEKNNNDPKYKISEYEEYVLNAWDEFYKGIKEKVIGFPIWSEYFKTRHKMDNGLPKWKENFIMKNKQLYKNNKEFIDGWLKKHNKLKTFVPTHRKFEWQAGTDIESLWDGVIQFRPSGIRVKKPDVFPALVAMVQIPIIGKYKRRLTPRECARLQSFPDEFIPSETDQQAYKQFGNSLNVRIVDEIIGKLKEKQNNNKLMYKTPLI